MVAIEIFIRMFLLSQGTSQVPQIRYATPERLLQARLPAPRRKDKEHLENVVSQIILCLNRDCPTEKKSPTWDRKH